MQYLPPLNRKEDEFRPGAAEWEPSVSRRAFLQFSTATLGLLGLSSCNGKRMLTEIVPYVRQPDALAEGESLPFATSQITEGLATGLVLQSFQGRPIKVEGNPAHPASLGGTSAWNQAFLFGLVGPQRMREPKENGQASSWSAFSAYLAQLLKEIARRKGEGLRLLTEVTTSPSFLGLVNELLAKYPGAQWVQYDPLFRANAVEGCELAFGEALDPVYDFTRAELIVSLDSDFLYHGPAPLRYAREFASRRGGNFLWMAEISPTLTGANADRRLALSSAELGNFARALYKNSSAPGLDPKTRAAFEELGRRRERAGRNVLYLAGEQQPAWMHAICQALNQRAGAVGHTVRYIETVRPARASGIPALERLTSEMRAGEVHTLISIGGNPAYNSPADLGFPSALAKVKHAVRLGLEEDETGRACRWCLPMSHPLEGWADSLAFDGTLTFQQPLIDPIFLSRSPLELVSLLLGRDTHSREILRFHWERVWGGRFPALWQSALEHGFLPGSAKKSRPPRPRAFSLPSAPSPRQEIELVFRPSHAVHDGRFYTNSWLQELPDPLTALTWGNAVLISPAAAKALNLTNERIVSVEANGRRLSAPVWIQPGHPEKTATLLLGYGRPIPDFGTFGYNAFSLVTAAAPDSTYGLIRPSEGKEELACAQEDAQLERGRDPVRVISAKDAVDPARPASPPLSLYPDDPGSSADYAWGMVIDLSRCIGCKACVAACQAENNIPSVGKEGVRQSREMHWIRVDRYFRGPPEAPDIYFQPVPCMHCEKAPCEPVCPVGATLHNDEGLNQMIYNRCVGTRYCSNNCPYKVRRFNFLEYNKPMPALEALLKNPDVSVRPRGVMEKCTYCVQRIQRARVIAERESRKIRDGEVITACQSACPARAIEFGNLKDAASRVSQWKKKAGHYALLEELGTRPRTTYLPEIAQRSENAT